MDALDEELLGLAQGDSGDESETPVSSIEEEEEEEEEEQEQEKEQAPAKRKDEPKETSKRPTRSARAKPKVQIESDMDGEDDESDLYPLEGKYVDEQDKEQLLAMTEIEREQTLASRAEEVNKRNMSKMLSDLVTKKKGGDTDYVAPQRRTTNRGGKAVKDSLKALKAKRASKASSTKTERKTSNLADATEESDAMDEDDDISENSVDLEERTIKRRRTKRSASPTIDAKEMSAPDAREPAELPDINSVQINRKMLDKSCFLPGFEEMVTGAFIRYLVVEPQNGRPGKYICAQVQGVEAKTSGRVEVIETVKTRQVLVYSYGEGKKFEKRVAHMFRISNSPISDSEYDLWLQATLSAKESIPQKGVIRSKAKALLEFIRKPTTDADLNYAKEKKVELRVSNLSAEELNAMMSRVQRQLDSARDNRDDKTADALEKKIEGLSLQINAQKIQKSLPRKAFKSHTTATGGVWESLNARNKLQNQKDTRQAHLAKHEQRIRDQLAKKNAVQGGQDLSEQVALKEFVVKGAKLAYARSVLAEQLCVDLVSLGYPDVAQ